MLERPIIAVSSCLLGYKVRYDNDDRRCTQVTNVLSRQMQIVAHCPEVGLGLGVPRPTIGLYAVNGGIELRRNTDGKDFTQAMQDYAIRTIAELKNVHGYIFKNRSPSCGPWKVPIMNSDQPASQDPHFAVGLFAQTFIQAYPWIPVETEKTLERQSTLENFIMRVHTLHQWHKIPDPDSNMDGITKFHEQTIKYIADHRSGELAVLQQLLDEIGWKNTTVKRQQYLQYLMPMLKNLRN